MPSYNNERNRIWVYNGGNQLKLGGTRQRWPDVDLLRKASIAFGVEAESVTDPDLSPARSCGRSGRTSRGRPYLLDVVSARRDGVGWASTLSSRISRSRRPRERQV